MKLIVGLGNPGREYKGTRHNVGFMVLDEYLGKVNWKNKMESEIFIKEVNNEQIIFVKPLTYMNLSGLAVSKIINFYKIDIKDILIVQDDLDMSLGTFKIKRNSSSGGHNGIKSIISEVKSEAFARLKIGIDTSSSIPVDKYVLGKFSTAELNEINKNMNTFINIIDKFINTNIEETMAEFNN